MKINPSTELIIAATIGGLNGAIIKLVGLQPTTITMIRFVIPMILVSFFISYRKAKPMRKVCWSMLLASFLNALRVPLYFLAFFYTSIANATIILFTWPILACIIAIIKLKEKINWKNALLILLSFCGIIIIYSNKATLNNQKDILGISLMFLSALCYAISMTIYKKQSQNYSVFEIIFYQNLVGAIVFLPFAFINPFPSVSKIFVSITFFGITTGFVAFWLFFSSLKKMKMINYSLLSYWEVPASLIFAIILTGEKMSLYTILGGILIIGADILLILNQKNNL